MAESSPQDKQRRAAAAYLTRTLQMNPLYEGKEIIALRGRALGLKRQQAPSVSKPDTGERRASALRKLEEVRRASWTASPDSLLSSLRSLDVDDLPDLRTAARRLEVLARNRPLIPPLTANKAFDGQFFDALKDILAGSPRETAVIREQVVASFRSGKLHKRGRRMVKLIQRELPEIYALEADWFDSLMRQKQVRAAPSNQAEPTVEFADNSSGGFPRWIWWLLIIALIKFLAKLSVNQ